MARKFSWNEFPGVFIRAVTTSNKTPKALRAPESYKEKDFLIPWMDDICTYPDEHFVRTYRSEIEDYFLAGTSSVTHICQKLQRLNSVGIRVTEDLDEMLNILRLKRMGKTLRRFYRDELRTYGKETAERENASPFEQPAEIDLRSSGGTDDGLYPYQEDAVAALKGCFLQSDKPAGILVMPTGSGKTRVATHFLLRVMISRGYQVIWLAHRAMLIDQAAESFYRLAPLVLAHAPRKELLRLVCVSGSHARPQGMRQGDDVIVGGVQTLCRNTAYLPGILGEKVVIVVDEAHHAIAPSYRRIIETIRKKRPNAKLLGLTATPERMDEDDTKRLWKLFGNNAIYSVTMSRLIAAGTLAKPVYRSLETSLEIEAIIDLNERKYIQKWNEMPDSLLEKVAKACERNNLIVQEYLDHREKYGKTVVFALNSVHCVTLNDAFQAKGIKSEYIYTLNRYNDAVIERFRDNDRPDHIDVLININMFTEGSDIPDIQTVFLTRPTGSDVMLMQMVGRGMRGKDCGGTETVNIVDFCDKWDNIARWMNPRFLLEDEELPDAPERAPRTSQKADTIPVDMIRDLVAGITYRGACVTGQKTALPAGWYDVLDEAGNNTRVLVFESQLGSYKRFRVDCESGQPPRSGMDALARYFGGFGLLPETEDLQGMLDVAITDGAFPAYHSFDERNAIDPYRLAQEYRSGEKQLSNVDADMAALYEQHGTLIDGIYGSLNGFRQRISDCLLLPNGVRLLGTVVEEVEREQLHLSAEPLPANLETLLNEVIEEQAENLPQPFRRPAIFWTDRDYSSYFAMYYTDRCEIRVNRLLNSASVPVEAVKFLIYHECLHQEFTEGHPKEFRQRERLYPRFQEWENFLDYQLPEYDRGEWRI